MICKYCNSKIKDEYVMLVFGGMLDRIFKYHKAKLLFCSYDHMQSYLHGLSQRGKTTSEVENE